LHFSSGQNTPPIVTNQDGGSDTFIASDVKPVSDQDAEMTSLRSKLEEMTRERDSLAMALDQLQVCKGYSQCSIITSLTTNDYVTGRAEFERARTITGQVYAGEAKQPI